MFAFELSGLIMAYLDSKTGEGALGVPLSWDNLEHSDTVLGLLMPLAILCVWLDMNSGALEQYQMYGKTVTESQVLQEVHSTLGRLW